MDPRLSRRSSNQERIRLDPEGRWFHGDYPILHERTIQFLYKNIARDEKGKYYLTGEDKPVYFTVEDVPFWITKVERTIAGYLITLTDGTIELLNTDYVWLGKGNVLYCIVKDLQFPARFLRTSFYEIMQDLDKEGNKFYLKVGSKKIPISNKAPKILSGLKGEKNEDKKNVIDIYGSTRKTEDIKSISEITYARIEEENKKKDAAAKKAKKSKTTTKSKKVKKSAKSNSPKKTASSKKTKSLTTKEKASPKKSPAKKAVRKKSPQTKVSTKSNKSKVSQKKSPKKASTTKKAATKKAVKKKTTAKKAPVKKSSPKKGKPTSNKKKATPKKRSSVKKTPTKKKSRSKNSKKK